ncbi:MAG: T9SS type A sorting domain-containing protein [Ignavibacteria bacterium]|nr:T9SS type A sorting domain-containing protein [Ignavibacteria bacterium]
MHFINKLICLLFYCLLVTEVFPQTQSYISTNGNINNLFPIRNIYNISTFTPLKRNSSTGVLDSLIYISTYGDRNRIAYYYNNDLSLNYFTNAVWSNGEWINLDKHTNTYNSEGNLESVLWEWFNTSSGEWLKDAKDVYNYDSLENRIFHLHQYFNEEEFVNSFKYENYFYGRNLLVSVGQKWIDNEWVNNSRIINTYTSNYLKDSALFQEWINNQWINSRIGIFEYDENHNTIAILSKTWQEQQWIDFALGLFEYDENNNLVLENFQKIVYNNWENWFRVFYEYDDKNNLIHLFGDEWENGQWVPEDEPLKVTNPDGILIGFIAKELFLYYSLPKSVEGEKNIVNGFNLFQNNPNPFNSTTKIKFSIPNSAFCTLTVFDLLGREVTTLVNEPKQAGEYEVEFNAVKYGLSSGVYLYRLTAGSFSSTKKFVYLR